MAADLNAQDGLYTLISRATDHDRFEVLGSLSRAHTADEHEAWLGYFADPAVAAVTITVTEAGYLRGADGGLDAERSEVAADLEALRRDASALVRATPEGPADLQVDLGDLMIDVSIEGKRVLRFGAVLTLYLELTPMNGALVPSVVDTKRGTAPSLVSRSASETRASPSHPSATRIATRRVRMLPSPGRANNDSAWETETSGVTSRVMTFDIAAGIFRIPSPAATPSASSAATFIRPDTIRSRTAGVCTRDSSKRKALMMCCFSTSVWLFQKSVGWV